MTDADNSLTIPAEGETDYFIKFSEAVKIFESHGFETIFEEKFLDDYSGSDEIFKVMWRDGVMIVCESFEGWRLNTAVMYYNWLPNSSVTRSERFKLLDKGEFIADEELNILSGYHDIREGFLKKLTELENNGVFLPTWVSIPFIWLMNYAESGKKYDRSNKRKSKELLEEVLEEVNSRKIALFPAEIREAMGLKG